MKKSQILLAASLAVACMLFTQFWTVDDSGDKLVLGQRIEPENIK